MVVIGSGFFQRKVLYRALGAVSTRSRPAARALAADQREVGAATGNRQCGMCECDIVICIRRATCCDWVAAWWAGARRCRRQAGWHIKAGRRVTVHEAAVAGTQRRIWRAEYSDFVVGVNGERGAIDSDGKCL